MSASKKGPKANPGSGAKTLAKALPKKSKIMLAFMAVCGLVTFALGLIVALYAFVNYRYESVPDGEPQEIVFDVSKGSSLSRIAANLEAEGAINSATIFKLVTKMRGNESAFKAGEFALTLPASMNDIYTVLSEGKAILYPVTIAEGRTSAQIIRQLTDYTVSYTHLTLPTKA